MNIAELAAKEQRIARRQAVDLDDAETLIEEIKRLRTALFCYTDAADVQSFGYEELRDNGTVARDALGYGDHDPSCKWPNESERCTCGLESTIRADFGVEGP